MLLLLMLLLPMLLLLMLLLLMLLLLMLLLLMLLLLMLLLLMLLQVTLLLLMLLLLMLLLRCTMVGFVVFCLCCGVLKFSCYGMVLHPTVSPHDMEPGIMIPVDCRCAPHLPPKDKKETRHWSFSVFRSSHNPSRGPAA